MNVLMFGWEFPPYHSGGLGTACKNLCRVLPARGCAITFVLPKPMEVRAASVRLRFAEHARPILFRQIEAYLAPYLGTERYARERSSMESVLYGGDLFDEVRRYALLAAEVARTEVFDLIHAHDWLTFGAGIAAREQTRKPLIAHVHSTEWDRAGGHAGNPRIYDLEREGLHGADQIIAVSRYTKEVLVRYYGIPPDKVSVVHNGTDLGAYDISTDDVALPFQKGNRKVVLFVGRVTLQKGPDYFLRMARRVLEYDPQVLFVLVGTGDMEGRLRDEAEASGLSNHIYFTGFLRGRALAAVYRAADLFVMSSVSEPFGLTAMESLMYGTPVLLSRQSGVSEVLSHVLKVDFWDIEKMSDQVLAVLEHAPLQTELRAQGQREARQCSWDTTAEGCMAVYRRVSETTTHPI